jgi:phosphonate transport system substrate-binding protein
VALAVVLLLGQILCSAAEGNPPFRVGFSSATFGEVNENDASAAIRVWAQSLARERGIAADPQPRILRSVNEIVAGLTNRLIDAVSMTTEEYAAIRGRVALQHCVVAVRGKSLTEDYVLLTHRDGGVDRLSDLRGRKLGLLQSARASLAPAWLETLLAREQLGPSAEFFGEILPASKTTKAVLPVFFRKLDGCVVTRSGFELMTELNPQTGLRLKILATSPPVVPVVFWFRGDFDSPIRAKLLEEVGLWHTTAAGRQFMNLFQCDQLAESPLSSLDSALQILAERDRLRTATELSPGAARSPASKGGP